MSEALASPTPAFTQPPTTTPGPKRRAHRARPISTPEVGATVRLRPTAAAARMARDQVRWLCTECDLPDTVARDATFIAGELVAISVRQVHAPLEFDIYVGPEDLTVRIRDLGAGPHAQSRPNGDGTTTSLQLVQCLARSWGISVTQDRREMWASIALQARTE